MIVEMKLNAKVDTYVNGNLIVQDVSSVVDDKTSQLSRQVYDTSEKGFRDALVKMGWMPPDVAVEARNTLEAVRDYLSQTGYVGSYNWFTAKRADMPTLDESINSALKAVEGNQ